MPQPVFLSVLGHFMKSFRKSSDSCFKTCPICIRITHDCQNHLLPRIASGQDRVKGSRFTLLLETSKKTPQINKQKQKTKIKIDKIYETKVSKTLDIRQQRIVIPEGWQRNEVSLMIAPATAPDYLQATV